jgi:hypothetical protein
MSDPSSTPSREADDVPDSDNSKVGENGGSRQGPTPCSCGFCDGVEIEYEEDPRTGEVSTFEKMSRRKKCPNCGGVNVQFRRSYVAHAADVVERIAGNRNVYAVHITLDADAVARAGIAPEETYKVWTDGGPWDLAKERIRYRDGDLAYLGSLSARPSDGMYHLHLVLVTRLSVPRLRKALHAPGLDTYAQEVARSETADSKEQFAAMWAAYAFDNAAHGASARLTSGGNVGAGYDSTGAKERRREAAATGSEARGDGDAHGRGPNRNEAGNAPDDAPANGPNTGRAGTADAPDRDTERGRAPPIRCDGHTFDTVTEYTEAVKGHLSARVGTLVRLSTGETAELLAVRTAREGERGLVRCTVHAEPENRVRHVPWREIEATNTPRVRTTPNSNAHGRSDPTDRQRPDGESDAEKSPAERYNEVANTSRFTDELDDGRRHVTEKNHDTGRVREYVLPPRDRT